MATIIIMNVPARIKIDCKRCDKQFIQKSKNNLYCKKCHKDTDKYSKVNESYNRESGLFLNKYREL